MNFSQPPDEAKVEPPTNEELVLMRKFAKNMEEGRGYMHIQATRPQTLGFAVSDSPIGLMAWIGEKFVSTRFNFLLC